MRIEGDYFYITGAEVEAGRKVTKGAAWDIACTNRTWVKRFGEDLHFKLLGLHMPEYLDSLRSTAALPEDDTQTCITGSSERLQARQLAIDILVALEVDLVPAQ